MKKLICAMLACLLLAGMVSVVADENDKCPCNKKDNVEPMYIGATETKCMCFPYDDSKPYTCACRDRECRYLSGEWHCGAWAATWTVDYNICLAYGGLFGCNWYH